ncbi:hypothetical protein BDP27DRAFT_1494818 [Rhodocollybia butyracea]|uniref:Uncharacterized protein n=1 Tax=Rhodocollybia butyracea TaxID=206335 RepID=A0A9P5PTP4_9AGAR|nr:hypothetical protein BDP27DRAFT_1494818 [Rhodocollybia butyracea]
MLLRIWTTDVSVDSDAGQDKSEIDTEQESGNLAVQDWNEGSSQITEDSADNKEINTRSDAVISSDTQGRPRESQHSSIQLLRRFHENARNGFEEDRSVSARKPHYVLSHSGTIRLSSNTLDASDLSSRHAIFQLNIDSEIFDSLQEAHTGEQSVDNTHRHYLRFRQREAY